MPTGEAPVSGRGRGRGRWWCQDSSSSACVLRYRHWKLGEDIDLIVRCEHDAVMTGAKGEVSFINVKTLNEWDSRVRASPVSFAFSLFSVTMVTSGQQAKQLGRKLFFLR